jgi:hypothetical protein
MLNSPARSVQDCRMLARLMSFSLVAPLLAPELASAHHSHAMYDSAQALTLTGRVADYQWLNPHVWLFLEVPDDDGQPRIWILESGSPTALARRGWTSDSMAVGDIVTVTFRRLRDGSRGGLLGTVELPNGENLHDPY